ncbi:MAG: phospho-N-acetylmuramoyl-pentapeptide-transferase [Clostridia bacterium]|nr:phospho-N-acetylmuramoyl-pentapeptide-transferase [Clostridia bacterium]
MLCALIPKNICLIIAVIFTPFFCAALLKLFSGKLPKDHGREFAVDGEKSAGKIRGAGVVFIPSFIVCALLFVPVSIEYAIYYVLLMLGMLSGYLDDRSEKPWGEYKKGIIDFVISAGVSGCFVYFNKALLKISFFGMGVNIHPVVYFILGIILVWMLINAVNCCDGIDGYCATISGISFISLAGVCLMRLTDIKAVSLTAVLLLTLLPYLWKNSQPSTMMMGDAGSRALGLFAAILAMKSGNALLVIPLCFVICLDGLLGIAKVSMIRFLHLNVMKKIRTPLHDHSRKNMGWSNTQVIYRYSIIQIIISAVTLAALK